MNQLTSSDAAPALEALKAAQRHHVSMTAMADQKASVLLAASLVVLALMLAHVGSGEVRWTHYVFGATALGTALFATLALMPRMLVLRDAESKQETNLLFCGHFAKLSEEDYVARVKKALATPEAAVEALTRDLFQMGLLVHQKKFRFLGYAYTVCAFGLLATGAAAVAGRFLH